MKLVQTVLNGLQRIYKPSSFRFGGASLQEIQNFNSKIKERGGT